MHYSNDINYVIKASMFRVVFSLAIDALERAFSSAIKIRICPVYTKYFLFFIFIYSNAHAQVDGIYQLEKKGNRFELILCNGKFSFFLIEKKNLKANNKPSCIHYVKRNSSKPDGLYQINKDTLTLTDSKFGNRYNFIIAKNVLIPIRPNYSFLLAFNKPMKKVDSDSNFLRAKLK